MHANLTAVYSPVGEHFEMSHANARDLTTHAGWSYEAPAAAKGADDGQDEPGRHEDGGSEEHAAEDASEGREDGSTGQEDEEGSGPEAVSLTEDDFEGLEDKEQVMAFLANRLPDFKPHHLAKRDTVVQQAIELSKAG